MPYVTGQEFAQKAYSFRDSGYTYQQYDCIGFVNMVRREVGLGNLYPGTNTLWRGTELDWKGTLTEAYNYFGALPQGCLLFKIKPENAPDYNVPPIPSQYYMDGIGNVTHVGIYTNLGLGVMQSGGYGGSGVHDSTFDGTYWTHVALQMQVNYDPNPTPQPIYSNPDLINMFWSSPNLNIGSWSVNTEPPSDKQKINANNIKSFFIQKGAWSLEAICGMLGNMQAESQLNPAFIQSTNRFRLPSSGTDINQLGNLAMQHFYMEYYSSTRKAFGIGLVQWDGYSNRNGVPQQKLVAYAMDNDYNWFDGWCQCYRLLGEEQTDSQYHFFNPVTINGVRYDFATYVNSTASPVDLAHAWQAGYERNAGGLGFRGDNALWWYDYFTNNPPPEVNPEDIDPLPIRPDPDQPGVDYFPPWFLHMFTKRKELRRPCRKM